ncbi:MAG: DUF1801 domain-containing protein [Anaerolineae bacterium]|nr:DUF1801 domain-containing protein [Anaerolineae bacterium]
MSDIEDMLNAHTPEVQQLASALRKLVKETVPELEEEGKRGWGNIMYKAGEVVCAISPHKDHVNVNFYKGTSLSDPNHLLEGTGKSLRHVKILSLETIPTEALAQLIQEAYQLRNA